MRDQQRKPSETIPLFNMESERLVLGKLLVNKPMFWEYNATLQPVHFYRPIHQKVYEALYSLHHKGKDPTPRVLASLIGPEYENGNSTIILITALIRDSEDLETVEDHVSVVVDLWRRRRTIEICQQFLQEAGKKDTDTGYMLDDLKNCVEDVSISSQAEPVKRIGDIARNVMIKSKKSQETGVSIGIDLGMPSIREVIGSIHRTDLGYVIAPQGGGKTVFGLQILRAAAERGYPGCLFELEMKDEDIAARELAGESSVEIERIEEGTYNFDDYNNLQDALDSMKDLPIYIEDRPKQTVEWICERATMLKRTKNISMIVVDHMRLVRSNKRFNNKFERVEYISGEFKALAKSEDIAVVGLSQVSQSSQRRDNPVPQITDSDLGAAINQDADWAVTLFRRDAWLKTNEPEDRESQSHREWVQQYMRHKGLIELRGAKRRRGPPGEMRKMEFDGPRYRLNELEGSR
jgi:replicative DNA helicase